MQENPLKAAWSSGRAVTNVWATIPSSYSTEILAHQGWDSITVDTQHGVIGARQVNQNQRLLRGAHAQARIALVQILKSVPCLY